MVLAACSPEEEAKELLLGGEQRGAFSYYLLDTLQRTGESLTYRDLFKRVNALVRARVSVQSPQMEATTTSDLDQPFLGGTIVARSPYFTMSHDKQRGWVIDGGAVHGIPAPAGAETTLVTLFPFDTQLEQLVNLSTAVGEARVQQVFPAQSAVAVTLLDGGIPGADTTYKAVVTALPLPPLVVACSGDDGGLALVRQALAEAGPDGKASFLVREGTHDEAELLLLVTENRYRIRRKGDGYALVVDTLAATKAVHNWCAAPRTHCPLAQNRRPGQSGPVALPPKTYTSISCVRTNMVNGSRGRLAPTCDWNMRLPLGPGSRRSSKSSSPTMQNGVSTACCSTCQKHTASFPCCQVAVSG